MVVRKASVEDIDSLVQLWFDFFAVDGGSLTQSQRAAAGERLGEYFLRHIEDDTFIAAIAEADEEIVSAAFLVILEKPTNLYCLMRKGGSLINVLTYPNYRRRGLAEAVLRFLFDEARKSGVQFIELLGTDEGLPLYEKLGFSASKYTPMRMILSD